MLGSFPLDYCNQKSFKSKIEKEEIVITKNKEASEKIIKDVKPSHKLTRIRKRWSNNSGEKETGPCLKSMTIKDGIKIGMIHGISPRK